MAGASYHSPSALSLSPGPPLKVTSDDNLCVCVSLFTCVVLLLFYAGSFRDEKTFGVVSKW